MMIWAIKTVSKNYETQARGNERSLYDMFWTEHCLVRESCIQSPWELSLNFLYNVINRKTMWTILLFKNIRLAIYMPKLYYTDDFTCRRVVRKNHMYIKLNFILFSNYVFIHFGVLWFLTISWKQRKINFWSKADKTVPQHIQGSILETSNSRTFCHIVITIVVCQNCPHRVYF